MPETPVDRNVLALDEPDAGIALALTPTAAALAALEASAALAGKAAAPATLHAYRADWAHYAAWCAASGFLPVPADPKIVGAYLASLAETRAPTTIRRRLAALGKMHRFNDLPWNAAHRDIQAPLAALLREHGRPVEKVAALSLNQLRLLGETCDRTARGLRGLRGLRDRRDRRDRAMLLIGFAATLRRSELVALQMEDVAPAASGLRLRIRRGKTDQEGQEAAVGLPQASHAESCPVLAFEAWQNVARRRAGRMRQPWMLRLRRLAGCATARLEDVFLDDAEIQLSGDDARPAGGGEIAQLRYRAADGEVMVQPGRGAASWRNRLWSAPPRDRDRRGRRRRSFCRFRRGIPGEAELHQR